MCVPFLSPVARAAGVFVFLEKQVKLMARKKIHALAA
jgi:hypothetical protein